MRKKKSVHKIRVFIALNKLNRKGEKAVTRHLLQPPSTAEVSFALLFAVDGDNHMATQPANREKPQKLHGQRK
jgi:hypothetical protein